MSSEFPDPGRGNGWNWPGGARKAHYFEGGRSLCRRWLFFESQEQSQEIRDEPGPDDCRPCWRKVKERSSSGD